MESLVSGLIGAIIATLLSVLYHHISEQKKIRRDVLLEIVSNSDEIYRFLNDLHVHKDHEYMDKKQSLYPDEYRTISRKLNERLLSSSPGAKIALAYGEGEIMGLYNTLRDNFILVSSELRTATRSGWVIENKKIHEIFSTRIDPLRADLEKSLLNESHSIEIVVGSYRKIITNLKKRISKEPNKRIDKDAR